MNTELRIRRVPIHQRLKRPHILRVPQQRQHTRLVGEPHIRLVRQAPRQAPRVVLERVRRVVEPVVDRRQPVRAQVQRVVGKRARRDAPAARPGAHVDGGVALVRVDHDVVRRRVVERRAVARERRRAAVEDGRAGQPARRRFGPVPVREAALVPALGAQALLVRPDEPPVPAEEVGAEVDRVRLVDVRDDPVVVARLCAGREGRGGLGLLGLEAEDGVCVGDALIGCQVVPMTQC